MRALAALVAFALVLSPATVLAHAGHGDASGLAYGFAHPLGGIDHILAMVAVGVFAFVLGGRALWLVPLSFVGMMAVGFLLGVGGIDVPFVELGIALSSVVIGAAAAWGRPMPAAIAMAVVGAFAIFHGVAHGAEMPLDSNGLGYASGFLAATALLHAAGIAVAMVVARLVQRHGKAAAQVAGGAFALGGLGVLAGWL